MAGYGGVGGFLFWAIALAVTLAVGQLLFSPR